MPDLIDFDALEAHTEELLTLLKDRQPGMTAFYPLAAEHIEQINILAKPLLYGSDDQAFRTTTRV